MLMAYLKSKLHFFFSGVGSLIGFFPSDNPVTEPSKKYQPSRTIEEAFVKDWEKLGGDMRKALKSVMSE